MRAFVATASLLALALTAGAADHPIAGDRVLLKDPAGVPARRAFKFKATRDPGIDSNVGGDPRQLGATLEITGRGAGDGSMYIVDYGGGVAGQGEVYKLVPGS